MRRNGINESCPSVRDLSVPVCMCSCAVVQGAVRPDTFVIDRGKREKMDHLKGKCRKTIPKQGEKPFYKHTYSVVNRYVLELGLAKSQAGC